MNEYAFLFRQPGQDPGNASPADMEELTNKWKEWIGGLAARDKIGSHGLRLATEGKVLKPAGVITDGPFVEIRERLGGFIVVKAGSLDEAATLAHGCPVLEMGGSVEIRPIAS